MEKDICLYVYYYKVFYFRFLCELFIIIKVVAEVADFFLMGLRLGLRSVYKIVRIPIYRLYVLFTHQKRLFMFYFLRHIATDFVDPFFGPFKLGLFGWLGLC